MTALGLVLAMIAFNHALVLPLVEPFLASLTALAAMIGFRFAVADKDRRLLQKSFALYLAPHVIDRMLSSSKLPELGGEIRNVTVFFSDIEGFSLIAETMSPDRLMSLMNEYLSEMTDIIESHGGYVDKYVGDSIVAVFGAPADDPDHAANAANAALDCCARLAELNVSSAAFRECRLSQRIGINSGEALVGNFGSRRRFNYSVMSDAVNLASRLEGANKFWHDHHRFRSHRCAGRRNSPGELDAVRIREESGADDLPVLARSMELHGGPAGLAGHYAEGAARTGAREFGLAAASFDRSAEIDRPSRMFRERTRGNWRKIRRLRIGFRSRRCRKSDRRSPPGLNGRPDHLDKALAV
jgi:adenylate cyclase/guanylate cyclase